MVIWMILLPPWAFKTGSLVRQSLMFDININIDINTAAPTGLSCVAMTVGLDDLNNGRLVVILILSQEQGVLVKREKLRR